LLLCAAAIIYLIVFRSERIETITYPEYPERPGLKVDIKPKPINLLLITVDTLRPDEKDLEALKSLGYIK
jgi:membrane-anchored protein YejM (alkaline phosphatase superfamily)